MDPEQAHHLAFRWIRLAARVPVLRTFVAAALAPRYKELRTEALRAAHARPVRARRRLRQERRRHRRHVDARLRPRRDRHGHRRAAARQPQAAAVPARAGPRADQPHGLQQRGLAAVAARLAARRAGLPDRRSASTSARPRSSRRTEAVGRLRDVDRAAGAARRLPGRQRLLAEHARAAQPPGRRAAAAAADRRPRGRRPHGDRPPRPAAGEDRARPRRRGRRRGRRPGRRARPGRHHRHQHHHRPRGPRPDVRTRAGRRRPAACPARPLKARSLEVLRRLYARVGDRITLVGVGGIEDAEDAWQRILAGATLVQGYSAFIYEGPFWTPRDPQGPRRPAAHAARTPPSPTRSAPTSEEDRA